MRLSPTFEADRAGRLDVERDERRAGIIGRPPAPVDDPAALRKVARIGEAAVAAQEPGLGRDVGHVRHAPVADRDHRAAQRRDGDEVALRRRAPGQGAEAGDLLDRDVEHEEARRLGRDGGADLAGQIGLDHRQGGEQGEAEAERDHQPAGLRGRAVEIGEREPEQRVARAAAAARRSSGSAQPSRVRSSSRPSAEAMKPAAKPGSRAVPMARAAITAGGGEHDQRAIAPARPPRRLEAAAEQGRGRHRPGAGERHQREDERR